MAYIEIKLNKKKNLFLYSKSNKNMLIRLAIKIKKIATFYKQAFDVFERSEIYLNELSHIHKKKVYLFSFEILNK